MSPGSPASGRSRVDDIGIGALRHEADILAVGLVRDRQTELARQRPRLVLGEAAERKAQKVEFGAGRAIQEIALVAREIAGAVQFRASGPGMRRT